MAKRRIIKSEFWSNSKVTQISRDARLLFIGLWNFCDDGGVQKFCPKTIKSNVFPGDSDISEEGVLDLLKELMKSGLLMPYVDTITGDPIIVVTGWKEHQFIDKSKAYIKYNGGPSAEEISHYVDKIRQAISEKVNSILDEFEVKPQKGSLLGSKGSLGGPFWGQKGPLYVPQGSLLAQKDSLKVKEKAKVKEEVNKYFCPELEEPASGPDDDDEETNDVVFMEFGCDGPVKIFKLKLSKVEQWRKTYTQIDVDYELGRAKQWLIDNPTKRKTANGMLRFLSGWLSRQTNSPKPAMPQEPAKLSVRQILENCKTVEASKANGPKPLTERLFENLKAVNSTTEDESDDGN